MTEAAAVAGLENGAVAVEGRGAGAGNLMRERLKRSAEVIWSWGMAEDDDDDEDDDASYPGFGAFALKDQEKGKSHLSRKKNQSRRR